MRKIVLLASPVGLCLAALLIAHLPPVGAGPRPKGRYPTVEYKILSRAEWPLILAGGVRSPRPAGAFSSSSVGGVSVN